MINEILLRRKNKVYLDMDFYFCEVSDNKNFVATVMKNVEDIGYTFSKELYEELLKMPIEYLKDFYIELITNLKKYKGANVRYNPMYPNFPESVMSKSEAELYLNAMVHYWSGGMLYPVEEKKERLPLLHDEKAVELKIGDENDLRSIFENLCVSKTSLSETDKNDLKWCLENTSFKIPNEIPLKENCAFIGKILMESFNGKNAAFFFTNHYFSTATDVLRLIVAMSDGDISLATNSKIKSFKRWQRRFLLSMLSECKNLEEDMMRHKTQWIRVGERLHPGECKYENVKTAFSKIRNNEKIEKFAGKVDKSISEKDYVKTLDLLKTRPGELARKLDYLLRIVENKQEVINAFKEICDGVSSPVLLQVRQHFKNRMEDMKYRVFFPKGSLARAYCIENNLPKIEEKYCRAIIMLCSGALVKIYKEKEPLGNIYLSDDFKNYVVPFSQRSASESLKTLVRGSRIPIDKEIKAVRGFIWWTNTQDNSRVDVDLSACMFDDDWNYMEHISYTNLKSGSYNSCHSGDITNGGDYNGDGVSEFIDIDIDSIINNGARYVVYQIYSYTGQKFSEWDHVMFGWMNREDVSSGEIYEPKTVEQKMNLTSDSRVCIPVIFDCVNREFIWCDMNLSIDGCHMNYGGNNVESNLKGVAATCYGIVNMAKPNLYDLIDLHISARGNRVYDKEEADMIFDVDDGITPFDAEVFMGEYL